MKKTLILLAFLSSISTFSQEYKVVTIVESIVPMGLGRSRIVDAQSTMDVNSITTSRVDGKSKQGDVDRGELKEAGLDMKETKLLNFYSIAGINFGNIATNDAIMRL